LPFDSNSKQRIPARHWSCLNASPETIDRSDNMSAATTPHRTNMATQHSPSKTPTRRVLGDVTPKALNTPASLTKGCEPSEVARAESPLKQVTTHSPTVVIDKENYATLSAQSKGRKRSIEEVDSAETAENLKMLACARDESLFNIGMRLTTDAVQKHTVAYTPTATRLPATNTSKENNPIGLADPGSPTERATPSPEPSPEPEPELQPEPLQATQKSNTSFADFIDYGMCASQKSQPDIEQVPTTSGPARAVVEEKKKSRADQLRTRLKFGLYKVKTGQACRRDAEIIGAYEADASYSSDALNASRSTAMTSSGESLGSHRVPNITISSPRREQGPVFIQANLDPFHPISKLGAAPVQFAIPTGNMPASSRMIYGYDASSSPPRTELPQSVSPDQLMSPVRQRSNHHMPNQGRDRIGEHDAEDINTREEVAHQRQQWLKQQKYFEGGVKANAADSLLQLMQSR
jgi:hypothetical protein